MKFTLLSVGSYGDFAPFTALGAKLKQEGHDVTIATHNKGRALCERLALPFHPIGGDLSELTPPSVSRLLFEADGFKKVRSFYKLMRLFHGVLDTHLKDGLEAAHGADVLIYHAAAFAGPHIAEYLKIPAVRMNLQPELPTFQHPSCLVQMPKWMGSLGNRMGHFISQQLLWQVFRNKINEWRCEFLQLPKSPFWTPSNHLAIRELVAFSPSLIKRPSDWDPSVGMVGFCRLQEGEHWVPPEELQHFLLNGEKPLYLGFGSLTETFSSVTVRMIVDVFKSKKIRAVISGHLEGLDEIELPSSILPIDYVPHDWLFPQVSAVIHHGGVGTLSSGLHAGKPTWIIPCIADQFYFGKKVVDWGVGPEPLSKMHFNRHDFEKRLDQLLGTIAYQENASRLQGLLNQENGVENASRWILNRAG